MARSVPSSPVLSSSPPPASPPPDPSAAIPSALLLALSPADLAGASREVLLALVERQQVELQRMGVGEAKGDAEEGDKEEGEERKDGRREAEVWRKRWEEVMGEQARMEEELAGRVEVLDKLRATVRDLEREKKETTKRYREQSDSFDSERQSWYDQEQHYKVRIANLSSSAAAQRRSRSSRLNSAGGGGNRRQSAPLPSFVDGDEEEDEDAQASADGDGDGELKTPRGARGRDGSPTPSTSSSVAPSASSSSADAAPSSSTSTGTSTPAPSATELSLRAQLDSLTTAHASLTTTLRALQTEMGDLKRVYRDLQEENESYEILLGEKTLSGELTGSDLFRKSFQWGEGGAGAPGAGGGGGQWNAAFGFAGGLEAVGEEDGEDAFGQRGGLAGELGELPSSSDDGDSASDASDSDRDDDDDDEAHHSAGSVEQVLLESEGTGRADSGAVAAQSSPLRRKSRRTDSLAIANGARRTSAGSLDGLDLGGAVGALGGPGGGLDLGAELEKAREEEEMDVVQERKKRERDERRGKRKEEKERKREEKRRARMQKGQGRRESSFVGMGESDLHAEIRQLREANKALTLYVSKIVDRVCSQEGFEKVLAVDYRERTPKTGGVSPPLTRASAPELQPQAPPTPVKDSPQSSPTKKPRPSSVGFFRSASAQPEGAAPSSSAAMFSTSTAPGLSASTSSAPSGGSGPRKSGGLTWDNVTSVFGFGSSLASSTSSQPSNIKPLVLGSSEARKLELADELEDEDDRRERERIRNEMLQLGFDPPPPSRLSPNPNVPRSPEQDRASALASLSRAEQQAKAELAEGRSSGFTDPPTKRMSLRMERRHSGRGASVSYSHSPVGTPGVDEEGAPTGLGIQEVEGEGGGEKERKEEKEGEEGKKDEGAGIGARLKRMSISAWSSPTL
ncbi:hypothetical protein JCM10207_004428 [Rhodosporidiobolus poonsookiae]